MADNTTLNTGTGGDVVASDDIAGVKFQRVKLIHGADGTNAGDVAVANALPAAPPINVATQIDTTTTPLGISAVYTSATFDTTVVGKFVTHFIYADQDGQHSFEESHDGSTWHVVDLDTYVATEVFVEEHIVNARYHRVRFLNGATGQTTFHHQAVCSFVGSPHALGIRAPDNIVRGGLSDGDTPVVGDAFDVVPALVSDSARSLTGGDLARLTVTTTGDTKVTLDSEIVLAGGDTAHGSADSGNPIKIGGKARTTDPTAEANGDRVDAYFDVMGRQVTIANVPRGRRIRNTITLSSTTETTLLAAAASTFHDLTKVLVCNTSATATRVDFRDSTAGTVMMSIYAPAGQTVGFTDSNDPVEQTTANNNWTAQLSGAVTDVRIFAQAVKKVG